MSDYVTRILSTWDEIPARQWNQLLSQQDKPTPFMQHGYLQALERSGCSAMATGWLPQHITLWDGESLVGACPFYIKSHSRGEYVFDQAWAAAYARHGLAYYPKGVVAVPFTPVSGSRLLARTVQARVLLLQALQAHADAVGLSSLHLLYASPADLDSCRQAGWLMRQTVQFHWQNKGYADFDAFLLSLTAEKRKKIRQERRKVMEAGVRFRWRQGADISAEDWRFFHRCYTNTYLAHGNHPYLSLAFFQQIAQPERGEWLMFVAERDQQAIAASLMAVQSGPEYVVYGRYWGCTERVDALHFEACYYQPLAWCIEHGVDVFEGGAQGEHKLSRALLPVSTGSAHWLAHPGFAEAVQAYLDREDAGIADYLAELAARSPLRR
jgi:uncharacterized protein